jgi:dTDP-glucose 4,6-dehydratase
VAGAGEGCTAVVNFAAETHVDRSILAAGDFVRTDVIGTHVLLEWARESGVRLLQVSTDEVYGDVPAGAASKEDDPLRPSSPYAASKAGGDLQVLAYVRTFGVEAVITRGANAYGPFQHPEKMIPLFVTNALDGEPLPVYGDGRQQRAWVHVEDKCAAIDLVLRKGEPGGVYNIGGEERDNLEVTKLILELSAADPGRYGLDSTRIHALGWTPRRAFEQGLAETVAWYRERRDWWEPIKSGEYRRYYDQQYAGRLRE